MDPDEISAIVEKYPHKVVSYAKGAVYCLAGYPLRHADIILDGLISTRMDGGESGKFVEVTHLRPGNVIAPAFIYSKDRSMPVSADAEEDTTILRFSTDDFTRLLDGSEKARWNFIRLLSNTNAFLTRKMRSVALLSAKEKIAQVLLSLSEKQGSDIVTLEESRQEMADSLGIQKISVIRALGDWTEEGVIKVDGKRVTILKKEELKF